MRIIALLLTAQAALALCGCASFSRDGGFDAVADATRAHLGADVQWPRNGEEQAKIDRQVTSMLAQPLSAADAVQIALLNNRLLRAEFEELGISEADLVQSGRLPNPRFDLRHASGAGLYDIEETLSFNVLALLTMPYARAIESRRFAQAQESLVLNVAQLAQETRDSYYTAVAAHQTVNYFRQVHTAAETSATLAQRMVEAGNWNRLDAAREQSFYADATMRLKRAELAEDSAMERLTRLLGLSAQAGERPALQLAERLADLPQGIEDLPDVERAVLQDRIDLKLMRMRIDELARSLKLTKSTRFVNVLDLGATRVKQGGREAPYETGYTITLEVPIFDSGAARVRKSEAIYAQAVDRFAQAAIEARSQIRLSYAGYRAAFDLAKQQRDEVVPLRQSVAQQNLQRYNASLISIFELLSDARDQAISVDGYIQSVRDFWIAKSALDGAILGNPPP